MTVMRVLSWGVGILFSAVTVALVVGHAVTHTKRLDAVDYARQHLPVAIGSDFLPINGVLLHVVTAGPETGPPVVLLHGHPDFRWGWHHQIVDLAAAGIRVIAPDLRGFNASSKPPDVAAYRVEHIAQDVIEVIRTLGYERAFIAGHDSGAALGWHIAISSPEIVRAWSCSASRILLPIGERARNPSSRPLSGGDRRHFSVPEYRN